MLVSVTPSNRKNKRYVARFESGERIHFGQPNAVTWIDGASETKRKNYIARHSKSPGQDWSKPKTAGALARFILWGDARTIEENIKKFNKRYY